MPTHRWKPSHFPRRRPPWWPAGEPFPPQGSTGAEAWHAMRGRFFRRMGALLALLFFFACSGFTLLALLSAAVGGWLSDLGLSPQLALAGAVIPLIVIVFGFALTARALRKMTMPVASLMEAAGRVANGDYTARVEEHGPHEVRSVARAFNSMTERLQSQDQQRKDLLADVTHELRTPLTVIQGNLEGLLDGVYPPDEAHLEPILEETRVMSRLVDDLHTLALAESGALRLQKSQVDLTLLLEETAAAFKPQAARAGVELAVEVSTEIPPVEADPSRIREVVSNLLANALRHTPEGGTVLLKGELEAGKDSVAISVTDNGEGIAAEHLPHIFERFYKSAASPGAGLGLAIAKNLVAAHGGEISAMSENGGGLVVRFTLPVEVG